MFDFGWAEILIIAAVALFVIGPQDIPKIAYSIGKFFRRIKYMQYALTGQFDDFMKSAEEKENPEKEKKELDYDPMDEAEADAELMEMMPLPEEDLNHGGTEAQRQILPLTEKYLDSAIDTVRICFQWFAENGGLPERSIRASLDKTVADQYDDMGRFKNREYWCVLNETQVIGMIGLMEMDEDKKTTDWVSWFCVHPDYRKQGVGAQLIDHLCEISIGRNKEFLKLWTSDAPNEKDAQALYEKKGFKVISTEPHKEGHSTVNIIRGKPLCLRASVVKVNQ